MRRNLNLALFGLAILVLGACQQAGEGGYRDFGGGEGMESTIVQSADGTMYDSACLEAYAMEIQAYGQSAMAQCAITSESLAEAERAPL